MGCLCSTGPRESSTKRDECSSNDSSTDNVSDPNTNANANGWCDSRWYSNSNISFRSWTKNRLKKNERQHCVSELAMAMHRAEFTAAAVVGVPSGLFLTPVRTTELVRMAKAEGSTVKVIDGHLYIDYKYVGRIPPNVRVRN